MRVPFGLETAPGENQVTKATQRGRGVECDPTRLLRVYITSDDKVLYDFAVFPGPAIEALYRQAPQ